MVDSVGEPQGRGAQDDRDRPPLRSRDRPTARGLGRRQPLGEAAAIERVREDAAQEKDRVVRHRHQREPARPRHTADDRGAHDRRDPPGQERGRREPVDRGERQHDGLGHVRAARDPSEHEDLVVDVDEDPRAGRRRRQQEGHDGEGQDQLEVHRQAAPPRALEDRPGQPLGEAAAHDGDAHRQHADQEEGHGVGETLQRVPESSGGTAQGQQAHAQERGDARREDLTGPQENRDQRDDQRPLAGHREAGQQRGQEQRGAEAGERDHERLRLASCACRHRRLGRAHPAAPSSHG